MELPQIVHRRDYNALERLIKRGALAGYQVYPQYQGEIEPQYEDEVLLTVFSTGGAIFNVHVLYNQENDEISPLPEPWEEELEIFAPEIYEEIPLTGNLLTDISELSKSSLPDLNKICSLDNDYINKICSSDDLWIQKLSDQFGVQKLSDKPEDLSYKEYYLQLNPLPERFKDLLLRRIGELEYQLRPHTIEMYGASQNEIIISGIIDGINELIQKDLKNTPWETVVPYDATPQEILLMFESPPSTKELAEEERILNVIYDRGLSNETLEELIDPQKYSRLKKYMSIKAKDWEDLYTPEKQRKWEGLIEKMIVSYIERANIQLKKALGIPDLDVDLIPTDMTLEEFKILFNLQ